MRNVKREREREREREVSSVHSNEEECIFPSKVKAQDKLGTRHRPPGAVPSIPRESELNDVRYVL